MNHEKIYADYCRALRGHEPIYAVRERYSINRSTLRWIINKVEKGDETAIRAEARREGKDMMWKYRYQPIMGIAKPDLKKTVVRDMFKRGEYTRKEIAQYTGITDRAIRRYLYDN
jgi:DNA invertase Pin-like site-specific DNA recombinase